MKELPYHILKKVSLVLGCFIITFLPFYLQAQDDSTKAFSDTTLGIQNSGEDDHVPRSGEQPVLRSVPDTTVTRMKKEKAFAYANDPAYWTKEEKKYRRSFWDYVFDFFGSDLVRVVFYFLIGVLIVFVLYRVIVVNDLLIFYSSKKKRAVTEETELTQLDPGFIDEKIQEAIDQKNYTNAIRFLYLNTLYVLNDKQQIQFHSQATNSEYLSQMSRHKLNKEFRFLTEVYEYVWYGKFEINEQQFAFVHNNFKSFRADI